jgi:SAM-dependent methyltransferase
MDHNQRYSLRHRKRKVDAHMLITHDNLELLETQCDKLGVPPTEDREGVRDEHVFNQMELEQYAMYHWIAEQIPSGTEVADVGCGPGIGAKLLIDAGLQVTGYDISPKARELATARGVPFVQGDPENPLKISIEDESYDYLTCIEVIEHIQDPHPFIAELSRAGTNNMTLFVSTPNRAYHMLFHRHADSFRWDGGKCANPSHWREWLPHESAAILSEHFDSVEAYTPVPNDTHSSFDISGEVVDIARYGPTLMVCQKPVGRSGG